MDNTSDSLWLVDTSFSFIDSIAFEYLFRHLNIFAITCVGTHNNPTAVVKQKLLKQMNAINPNLKIEIYEGSNIPFINYEKELGDDKIINPYELDGTTSSETAECPSQTVPLENVAAVKILEAVNTYGKKLNILTLGPLTNLAIAVLIDSSIADKVNSLVVTGGSLNNWGNSGNAAEYNFRHDPVAAKNVIKYFSKNKIVIPLEIDRELSPKVFNENLVKQLKNKELIEKFNMVINNLNQKGKETEFALVNFNTLSLFSSLYAINQKILSVSIIYPADIDIIGKLTRGILVMEKYLHVQSGNLTPTHFATFYNEKYVLDLVIN
jgi:inosine-uridine nucleoside N-ribohydrolase